MSTQSDPCKGDLASDGWRERGSKKRPRNRPFVIEWRYIGNSAWMRKRWGKWQKWSAYETEKQRGHALEQKQKSDARLSFEYRAVNADG